MRALVHHGPGEKAWTEKPDPRIAAATDAIVRLDSATICGTDLLVSMVFRLDLYTPGSGGHQGQNGG